MTATRFDLAGKRAVVTGGSRGIGLAISRAFAEHGAHVLVAARTAEQVRSAEESLSRLGPPAIGLVADVADAAGAASLAREAVARLGWVDILVNCAGVGGGGRKALEIDDTAFDRLVAVNLRAPFVLCREIGRHMIERGQGGRIINVTSIDGVRPNGGGSVYSATKAGLDVLTKVLAAEWAPHGILVNSIAPGWVRTDMVQRVYGTPLEGEIMRHTPLGRWGAPEEIAGIAVYLASGASAFTTGATMIVDGGYSWL